MRKMNGNELNHKYFFVAWGPVYSIMVPVCLPNTNVQRIKQKFPNLSSFSQNCEKASSKFQSLDKLDAEKLEGTMSNWYLKKISRCCL